MDCVVEVSVNDSGQAIDSSVSQLRHRVQDRVSSSRKKQCYRFKIQNAIEESEICGAFAHNYWTRVGLAMQPNATDEIIKRVKRVRWHFPARPLDPELFCQIPPSADDSGRVCRKNEPEANQLGDLL